MKKMTLWILLLLTAGSHAFAQHQYEVVPDVEEGKYFKGIISRQVLMSDTSMSKWFMENTKAYTPNAEGLETIRTHRDSIELMVFMGTWCHDSHFIIPKLFTFLDAAGFSNDKVVLIAADRNKKTLSHLAEALDVKLVPTIIVWKNGKELGRVVEYGKYGMFDKELGEIVRAGFLAE